jgi:hypothetical protein
MEFKNALFKQANDLWYKEEDEDGPKVNSWNTEASMLHHMGIQAKKCPGCNSGLPQMVPQRDAEGDTIHWIGKCSSCGAKLTIFND